MIYSVDEIKSKVKCVADRYDIKEIYLFGSYFNNAATESSDIDLLVKYGERCKGMKRIYFMNDLEKLLEKKVDVINIEFRPDFMLDTDFSDKGSVIYVR